MGQQILPGLIAPITEHQNEYAGQILDQLKTADIRCGADFSGNKIGGKIRDAEMNKVHTMLVLGKKEQESASVALRIHGQGDQGVKPLELALAEMKIAITERTL